MDRNKLIRDRSTKPMPRPLVAALYAGGAVALAAPKALEIVNVIRPKRW